MLHITKNRLPGTPPCNTRRSGTAQNAAVQQQLKFVVAADQEIGKIFQEATQEFEALSLAEQTARKNLPLSGWELVVPVSGGHPPGILNSKSGEDWTMAVLIPDPLPASNN